MGTDKFPSTSDLKYSDENVVELATQYIPSLRGTKIVEKKQALRPMPIDGQSVIGFSEKLDNLYIIMTHSGVTLAPLIGEIASIEILEGARVDFLSNFRPGRFI
jgi:glycine/D-amino acid oxidase-like deaminating enzyme